MAHVSSAKVVTENDVRKPVVKWWREDGNMHVRQSFRAGVRAGVPDDLFVGSRSFAAWCEFKRPGKKPTKLQMQRIIDLNRNGHNAFWADSAEAAMRAIDNARYTGRSRFLMGLGDDYKAL